MKTKKKLTPEEYSALACAVAVLDGTAGGYTPDNKYTAKLVLMKMMEAGVKQ